MSDPVSEPSPVDETEASTPLEAASKSAKPDMNAATNDVVWPPPPGEPAAADVSYEPLPEVLAQYKRDSALAALVYFLFNLLLPLIRLPRSLNFVVDGILMLVATAIFMYLQLYLARSIVRTRRPVTVAIALTALFTVLWFVILTKFQPYRFLGPHLAFSVVLLKNPLTSLLLTLALSNLGTVLSRIIREPNVLLPVAFVAMPIDYLGAMAPRGFTHDTLATRPDIVRAVSVSVPAMGSLHPLGFVGPGDVLFMAFFLMVVQNLRMNEAVTFKLMYALLTITMLAVIISPFPLQIAALIPMGLAVLIANRKCFNLQRSEVFAMFYAIAIVMAVVVAFYLTSHKYIFKGK